MDQSFFPEESFERIYIQCCASKRKTNDVRVVMNDFRIRPHDQMFSSQMLYNDFIVVKMAL